ncbi:hypothetical protein SAMN05421759_102369 [Roseivivax lentus]|uniref:Uncharacterized protein n=1 Tax=Roseivivax lentus TaxID=633194 RepID=A0A1N7L4H4_9RHOB|nr:hypothetical protein [Roseivivax lentus]SIS68717.1 hypothetical protein SAMN05421759_102369 [Roseivivax lentus]
MSRVEVLGRDVAREAYRVRTASGEAFVPECLMGGLRPGDRPSHQDAYEWIAAHRRDLDAAVAALARGAVPKAPYDIVSLVGTG